MPHDNAALMREAARELEIYENGPVRLATRLRAAADALAAGGEAMDTINGVLALGRSVRFYPLPLGIYAHTHGPQHDAEYEGDDLRGVLAAIIAARRAEEPRHD